MLKCLAFNDETFFYQALKKYIQIGYRFIGQHIGYRLSNRKNYRLSAKIFISVHPQIQTQQQYCSNINT